MPTETHNSRYRLLDAWRGVACLIVVVYHAGFALNQTELAGGASGNWARWGTVAFLRLMSLGVPIFFVISGYCIAASADANRRRGLSAWSFLDRRVRRIYPAYWVALMGFVLVLMGLDATGLRWLHRPANHVLVLGSPGELGWSQWVGNITLTETWRPLLGGPVENMPFTRVAWTLCYEEQFYFVCFVVLWLAPRRLNGMLMLLTFVVVPLRIWSWYSGGLARIEGTFPMLWHEFAVGLAVYWRLNVARRGLSKRAVEVSLAVLCAVGLLWGLRSTAGAGAFGLVLCALRRWDGQAERWALLRVLAAFGRRCYSIYLAHLPVCTIGVAWLLELGLTGFWTRVFVVVPLVSIAATAGGWLFFRLVESRLQNVLLPQPHRDRERTADAPTPVLGALGSAS